MEMMSITDWIQRGVVVVSHPGRQRAVSRRVLISRSSPEILSHNGRATGNADERARVMWRQAVLEPRRK